MWPVFRSCILSPPMAAAQQTTAPTIMAPAAPTSEPVPSIANNSNDENNIVAMVTPEIGLLDEPTTPAIYAATAENKKPNTIITTAKRAAIPADSMIPRYKKKTGTSNPINA